MAKPQYKHKGRVDLYEKQKPQGSSFGDILGGIVMFAIGFVVLASCVG
jgi:hypothetical protein